MLTATSTPAVCFIDSNIWLYAFLQQQDPQKTQIAQALVQQNRLIFVSTQIINEVCRNLIRKAGFTEQEIRLLIQEYYSAYSVVELDQHILLHASTLREQYQFAFWDSIIISSALQTTARTLYSEDMQDGMIVEQRLTIVNPFTTP